MLDGGTRLKLLSKYDEKNYLTKTAAYSTTSFGFILGLGDCLANTSSLRSFFLALTYWKNELCPRKKKKNKHGRHNRKNRIIIIWMPNTFHQALPDVSLC